MFSQVRAMDDLILITWLNDFIFCPISIYFHNLYGTPEDLAFKENSQINGTDAHKNIDTGKYSSRSDILIGISVYCAKYGLTGKIDQYFANEGALVERKKKIRTIYDGYIFQLYGQCFAMREVGHTVKKLFLHSLDDNKRYPIPLPEDDPELMTRFEK